ncbi:MAG: 23S rRNA (pseudouridine(1915)-N(3))-methyltransferase RlmH [Lachnospiraceae bacterium]|nr:23S rRNA (pseudouridine(1915)-N(3))-methyltransferase RlmH [Lachnospiraceae bacterium]
MTIRILCAGRIKEKYYTDAVAEYMKRLQRYVRVEIVEVEDEKTPDRASKAEQDIIKAREGSRLMKKIRDREYVAALAIDGDAMDSVSFSSFINEAALRGVPAIDFVIGGSLGLSDEVLLRADRKISFSAMTFPHQLMRVILLEQVYRAEKIIAGEPYHK